MVSEVLVPAYFGPKCMAEVQDRDLLNSWWPGSKKRKRKELRSQYSLQEHIPSDLTSSH